MTMSNVTRYSESRMKYSFFTTSARLLVKRLPLKEGATGIKNNAGTQHHIFVKRIRSGCAEMLKVSNFLLTVQLYNP